MASSRPPAPEASEVAAFYAALGNGRANASTAGQVASRMGLAGQHADRHLRLLAQHAVEAGMLVCSSNSGYYRPATMAEAQESIRRIASQGALMCARARHMQSLADKLFLYQEKLL